MHDMHDALPPPPLMHSRQQCGPARRRLGRAAPRGSRQPHACVCTELIFVRSTRGVTIPAHILAFILLNCK